MDGGRMAGWIEDGDSFRSDVNDDLLLIAGPRVLLPPDQAKGYIAEERFAKGMWHNFQGGSVPLTSVTPLEAIIGAPGLIDGRYDESDYLVNGRALSVVTA
jgi:hypothetical protein